MINFLRRLARVRYPYPTRLEQQRARVLNLINLVLLPLSILYFIAALVGQTLFGSVQGFDVLVTPVTFLAPLVGIVIYVLVNSGQLRAASWAFILVLLAQAVPVISTGLWSNTVVNLLLPLVIASGLLARRSLPLVIAALLVFVGLTYVLQIEQAAVVTVDSAARVLPDLLLVLFSIGVTAVLLTLFNGQAQAAAEEAQHDTRAFEQLTALAGRMSAADASEESLIAEALRFCEHNLGSALAQMYRIDSEGGLRQRLRAAFGSPVPVDVDEVVPYGDTNILTQAARTGAFFQASVDGPEIRRRHFLKVTRCGAAVPVMHGETVFGVLDIQSDKLDEYNESQVEILRSLAQLLAGALHTQQTLRGLRENLRQYEESRDLRPLTDDRRSPAATQVPYWDALAQQSGQSALGFDAQTDAAQTVFTAAHDLPEPLRLAMHSGDLQLILEDDVQIVSVPILLHNEVFGAMSFRVSLARALTERQLDTVRAIARRLALALENRRLFEQSQAQVIRERKANEIANALLSATEVQSVLRLAVENFNEALGAINTEIAVQTTPDSRQRSEEMA
jgi:GAF domain-containing protein